MKYICPLITVNDINQSKEFYVNTLDQKIKYDFGENVTFEGDFAIHLKSHFQSLINNKPISDNGNNFELYFEHDDVEEIFQRLEEQGVVFIHEIREQPWKQKVMRFYDPDNNIIEVGESMEYLSYRLHKEGMDIHEIAKIITMPLEFVQTSIKQNTPE